LSADPTLAEDTLDQWLEKVKARKAEVELDIDSREADK